MASLEAMTPATTAGEVAFEVERFEWTTADRLEVEGRWFGLRGHRFMRPALVVDAGDDRRRMLALLEHKPWAAGDGDTWTAAFTWEGKPVDLEAAELSVAPSLAIELPPVRAPGAKRRTSQRKPPNATGAPARRVAHSEGRSETLARDLAAAEARLETLKAERDEAVATRRRELAELRAALGAARSEAAELRTALERAREEADEARAEAVDEAELDTVKARARKLKAALDAARVELEQARGAGGEAVEAGRASLAALERERDEARLERDSAGRERDASRRERNELVSRLDAAASARDDAVAEREMARTERDALAGERDRALAEREQARSERDTAVADRAADPPVDRLRPKPAAAALGPTPARARAGGDDDRGWGPRLVALAPLIALVVVLALLLRGVV